MDSCNKNRSKNVLSSLASLSGKMVNYGSGCRTNSIPLRRSGELGACLESRNRAEETLSVRLLCHLTSPMTKCIISKQKTKNLY